MNITTSLVLAGACCISAMVMFWQRREPFEGLRVGITKHGRGVFATKKYAKGDTIEVCPLLVDKSSSWGEALADYIFNHGDGNSALALGYCSLYNHSLNPNVDHEVEKHTNCMVFKAARNISVGEQMFISYGEDWWKSRGIKPK